MADLCGIAECVKGQGGTKMSQSILLHDGTEIPSCSCLRQMGIFSDMFGQDFLASEVHSLIDTNSLWKGD